MKNCQRKFLRTIGNVCWVAASAAGLLTAILIQGSRADIRVWQTPEGNLAYQLDPKDILTGKAKQELSSGFTTRVFVLTRLLDESGKALAEQADQVSVHFDLWEEKYELTSRLSGKQWTLLNRAEVESWISSPGPYTWLPLSQLNARGRYRLETIESINPISQEKLESLKSWMIQKRITNRSGATDLQSNDAPASSETPFTALFFSLWKKAASGQLTGEAQRHSTSESFTPGELKPLPSPRPSTLPKGKSP